MDVLTLMPEGDVCLLGKKNATVQGTFSKCSDGRQKINEEDWALFVENNALKPGLVVILLFHLYEGDLYASRRLSITVDCILT